MKKIVFLALTGLLALTSCSDFLDEDNKSNVTSDKYYKTSDGFETLVNYAYGQLKPLYNGAPSIFSSGTDLYQRGRNAMPDAGLHNYKDLNPENGAVATFYTNCYIGIQAANCVLYYAETTDKSIATIETRVAKRVAEAKFLRAFYYLQLVQQFGGVPLVKDYVNTIVTNVPRDSTVTVYQYIFDELSSLVADDSPLPATDMTGRVSKQCVYHFLAKAYLTAGWDLGINTYFTTAANYAMNAINLGSGLNETFSSLWKPANDNNHQEVVFAIQYDRTSSTGAGLAETANANQLQSWFGSYYGGQESKYKYCSSNFVPTLRLVRLFEKGDSRYDATFMTKLYCKDIANKTSTGDYYAPYTGDTITDYVGFYFPAHYNADASAIAAWRAADPTHRTGTIVIPADSLTYRSNGTTVCDYYTAAMTDVYGMTCIRKFDDPKSTYGTKTCYRDIVLARLAETYFIAAEAYLKAGEQILADNMLNVVRERAYRESGLTPAQYNKSTITIDDILNERALELAGELFRFTDLRRTKKLVEYNVLYNPDFGDATDFTGNDGYQKLYRPIPQTAINLNTATINQNPGYGSAAE